MAFFCANDHQRRDCIYYAVMLKDEERISVRSEM